MTTPAYQSLTPSGRGAVIIDRRVTDISVDETRALLERYQWLAFKKNPVSRDEIVDYLQRFGDLVKNDRREGPILKLDASKKDQGEVLLGDGFMPLHRDGALMGTHIAMVGIYCDEYKNVKSGGRTFISDVESGVKEVPEEYLAIIREKGIEGRPVDRYYTKAADKWHWIPGFLELEGKSFLNIGLPYRKDEKPSWLVRIPGVDEEKAETIFESFRAALMSEKYCYYHDWSEGELLLLDNRRTLHGREAFEGQRSLSNLQVIAA